MRESWEMQGRKWMLPDEGFEIVVVRKVLTLLTDLRYDEE
jgi:hypothetical protein